MNSNAFQTIIHGKLVWEMFIGAPWKKTWVKWMDMDHTAASYIVRSLLLAIITTIISIVAVVVAVVVVVSALFLSLHWMYYCFKLLCMFTICPSTKI